MNKIFDLNTEELRMSRPQKVLCPHCRLSLPYEEKAAGTSVECKFCGQAFVMPKVESSQDRTTSPEPYRPLPPLVDKPPPFTKPPPVTEPAIPWPTIPRFEVVEQETDYDEEPRSRRRKAEAASGASRDYSEKDYVRPPNYWKREEVSHWQTVASGLNTMLFGTILGVFALVVSFITVFPLMNHWGRNSPYYGYGYGPSGPLGFLCFSGTCMTVSGLLFIIGQGMCCAAPVSKVRTNAVVSLILLLISVLLMVVQVMVWSNYATVWNRVGPRSLTFYLLPGLMAWFLGAVSHLVFAKFLQDVANFFRNPSTARQAGFYLVISIIYFALNLLLWLFSFLPYLNSSPYNEYQYWDANFGGLGSVCFGCFGLFVFIALVSLLHQTRSLIKDRLTAGKGRLPTHHEWEDMEE